MNEKPLGRLPHIKLNGGDGINFRGDEKCIFEALEPLSKPFHLSLILK